jgi:hypothetical protein
MEIPKDQILALIRDRGGDHQAGEADQQLPDKVDPEKHGGILEKFGVSPQELIEKFAGGKLGDIGGKLGL